MADATRTYPQFIVGRLHRVLRGLGTRDGAGNVDLPGVSEKPAGQRFDARPYFSCFPSHYQRDGRRRFYLAV
jgi:hypothetical protein